MWCFSENENRACEARRVMKGSVCPVFVDAAGACRRRRGRWEKPGSRAGGSRRHGTACRLGSAPCEHPLWARFAGPMTRREHGSCLEDPGHFRRAAVPSSSPPSLPAGPWGFAGRPPEGSPCDSAPRRSSVPVSPRSSPGGGRTALCPRLRAAPRRGSGPPRPRFYIIYTERLKPC